MLRVTCVTTNPALPSWRIRHLRAVEPLRAEGVECRSIEYPQGRLGALDLLRWERGGELVVAYKWLLDGRAYRRLRLAGRHFVFDFDDLVTHSTRGELVGSQQKAFGRSLSRATAAVCGNAFLADLLPVSLPNRVLPSPVPHEVPVRDHKETGPALRVGWVGLGHNLVQLERLAPQLAATAAGHRIVVVVISDRPAKLDGVPTEYVEWRLETQEQWLATLDVGLMPLDEHSVYSRGKCSYKALQCMAAGVPCVAADVGMNREVVAHRENGILVSGDGWAEALGELAADSAWRAELGACARETVLARYTYPVYARALAEFLREQAQRLAT